MDKDSSPRLLVATRNLGKAREYSQLLRDIPFEVVTLEQVGVDEEVEETGSTFEENARLKADAYASLSGLLTLADDSGLEVDALGGEPGVRSARYAGPEATDRDRVDLLLSILKDVKWGDRTGRFRCVIAIARPSGEVKTVTGKVEGFIQDAPKGDDGFGYDPVFYVPHLGKTIAELSTDEKNGISHRGQAARKALALLESMLKAGI